jgi:hypothetical protein
MIIVFKTSVKTNRQVGQLKPYIDKMLPTARWNFDLTDCDKILRVDCEENVVLKIIDLLNRHNYSCKELE